MEISIKLLPSPSQRRSGTKNLGIKYIVCHDTGNDGSTAFSNVNYYIQSANEMQASAHYFVDDKAIVNCIPETEKAWHVRYNAGIAPNLAGSFANDVSLGIELCFSSKNTIDNMKAYNNYVQLIASLCKKYGLDPKTKLVQHAKLDPSRRTDPLNAFKYVNKTWDQFISDIVIQLVPEEMVSVSVPKSKVEKVLSFLKTI